jgi:Protein of unknown function (DUF4058)
MPSPFPGMDPYLESPSLWPGLHVALINHLQADLNPRLLPVYFADIETRVYVVRDQDPARQLLIPDVTVEKPPRPRRGRSPAAVLEIDEPVILSWTLDQEVEEARIAIKERETNRLVTILEVLSPTNKVRGSEGRESFLSKRRDVLSSDVHWLEIDLLRAGERSLAPLFPPTDYWVFQSRAGDRKRPRGWPVGVRDRLPVVGVPLAKRDSDLPLDLRKVLDSAYDQMGYEYRIDYSVPPDPPLDSDNTKWAHALLRKKGLRR